MKNNIINNIIKECYKKESILDKSYDDITNKILDNIEKIDISKFKFPKKKFDCIFYGGGLKGYYLFGAVVILRKMIKSGKIKIRNYKCISIGVLAAIFILAEIPIHKMRNIYEFGKENNKLKLNNLLLKICDEILPDNVHELCNGKLNIVISKLTSNGMKPEIVNNFKSKKDLLNIIYASCFIPYLTTNNIDGVKIKDDIYYDGAFTNSKLITDNNDLPQLVFDTINVDYNYNNMFRLNDKYPELLMLKGVIEFEKFIKKISSKKTKIENIPIEWIPAFTKNNNELIENIFYNIFIIFGYILSYVVNIFNLIKNLYNKN